jgi:hypothetical protein
MRFVFSWDKAQENGSLFKGRRMGDLLVELLTQECEKHCDQCNAGDCTHGAAGAVLDYREHLGPHWSWDNEAKRGTSFHGYHIDELLGTLLKQAADEECSKSCGAWCIHESAREVLSIKRLVEHPSDCPECKRIHDGNLSWRG